MANINWTPERIAGLKSKQHFTSGEVGYLIGRNPKTVAEMANRKEIECFCSPGSKIRRFPRAAVVKAMTAASKDTSLIEEAPATTTSTNGGPRSESQA